MPQKEIKIGGISAESLDIFLSEISSIGLAKDVLNARIGDYFLYRRDVENNPQKVARFFNLYPPETFIYTPGVADVLLQRDMVKAISGLRMRFGI